MPVHEYDEIDESLCMHIYSFGTLTKKFEILVDNIQEQFGMTVKWDTTFKNIISFGGWPFLTDPKTIEVF